MGFCHPINEGMVVIWWSNFAKRLKVKFSQDIS